MENHPYGTSWVPSYFQLISEDSDNIIGTVATNEELTSFIKLYEDISQANYLIRYI